MKLDPVKVGWIIRQKERGTIKNSVTASTMEVSVRRVQRLYSSYRRTGMLPELKMPGRKRLEVTESERETIVEAYNEHPAGAFVLERIIDVIYGRHIPHNRIHGAMKSMGIARDEPRKRVRKKWIRYERGYSSSLWHTDWKLIEGRGWFTAYLDDASRLIVGSGLFSEATSDYSVEVLKEEIKTYGKPASILTDRGIQFYANEAEEREKGLTAFERYLIENQIRQILARVSHPQTNGKVESFFRTLEEKLPHFKGIDELIRGYNTKRPHISLSLDIIETPNQAFIRRMPEEGIVTDEESGEVYHARKG